MRFPAWRKHLKTLLTSADRFWGPSANAVVGAALVVSTMPPATENVGLAKNQSLNSDGSVPLPRTTRRPLIHGFVLSRGPHKAPGSPKAGTQPPPAVTSSVAPPPTTRTPSSPPPATPRVGSGHSSHSSHSSHASHSSHRSGGL